MTLLTNIPVHTIVGDNPNTVSFLSRIDTAPSVQTWVNAHTILGGKLRLIDPCFKSKIDFSQVQSSIVIEIEGGASCLINGGELELWPGVKLIGTGGADAGVAGNFNINASLRGFNYAGLQAPDDRLAGLDGYIVGPYYRFFSTGFSKRDIQ